MIDALYEFLMSSSLLSVLTVFALKTTVIVSLGIGLWALLYRASASARHLVLASTLLAVLAIPLASELSPFWRVPVKAPTPEAIQTAPETSPESATVTTRKNVATNSTQTSQPAFVFQPGSTALLFVSFVSAVILLHLALGLFQLWQISRRAKIIPLDDCWYALLPPASRKRVTLLLSDQVASPHTWGFRKPVVVLPASSSEWNTQNQKNALLHELSHIERYDWIVQVIARFICAMHWFNPLVWFVYRKLILEAERAADDCVLLSGSVAHDYAEQLVSLTHAQLEPSRLPLLATGMAARNLLPDRVHSILSTGVRRMPLHTTGKVFVLLSIASVSLLVGSAQLTYAHGEDNAHQSSLFFDKAPTPLIQASAAGDIAEVQRLITNGADVNETRRVRKSPAKYQRSALTTAAKAGHADIVKLLIDSGAPVDRVVKGDATALIEALKENHEDVARLLISRSADVSLTVRGDGSPLIAAAMANNNDMIRLLLDEGADPNDWVRGDASVLYHAARKGNTEMVQLLIDAGVNVNQKMRGDGNALIIATRKGHKDVIRLLMNAGARADSGVQGDGNAMISAAQRGDVETLAFMIETGGNVDASVKGDGSPLIAAARNGHQDAVNLLLRNGASIDKVVYGDENALIGASWAGDVEMVRLLLDAGANPNIKAKTYLGKQRSALSQAKVGGHEGVIQMLVAAGAEE
ncbi:MAG: ankyrin repeat domain-containing protein [Gammaproteobacteria bacterium]